MIHYYLSLASFLILSFGCTPKTKEFDTESDEYQQDTGESDDSDGILEPTSEPTTEPEDQESVAFSEYVDPNCIDGQYADLETFPTPNIDISYDINNYNSSNYVQFIYDVLAARYPIGHYLVQGGMESEGYFSENCIDFFLYNTSSAQSVIFELSTVVHECGHFFNVNSSGWGENVYHITDTIRYTCTDGSIPSNGGGVMFSRSLIKQDEYNALYPPCSTTGGSNCDFYADTYLNGNPNDGNFESGDQGFGMLLEETVQYVNSLATGYAFHDFYGSTSITERDGILTFLWYTQRYLKMAREQYPNAYQKISQDPNWREAILTIWGRSWFYLEHTKNISVLGIHDDFIESLVTDSDLLEEIERLREIQGCQ